MRPMSQLGGKARLLLGAVAALSLPLSLVSLTPATASDPTETTLEPPADAEGGATVTKTWTGSVPLTGSLFLEVPCTPATCDTHDLHVAIPEDYWDTHDGSVRLEVGWEDPDWDLDVVVVDDAGRVVKDGATTDDPEVLDLGELPAGDYTVQVRSFLAQPEIEYNATLTLTSNALDAGMVLPEDRESLMDDLTVHYPLRVVFVGRDPSPEEIAELRAGIPETYQPTVANKSGNPDTDGDPAGATSLINWNKVHYSSDHPPYFLGMRYQYDLQVLTASDEYAQALYQVAEDHTAQDQTLHDDTMTAQQVKYDATFGKYRMAAKGGDPTFQVTDPSKDDLVDAYAVEDWMFETRTDRRWDCAFTDAETGECVSAAVLQDTRNSYHDPYYDKSGLDLDTMPQGVNKGSTYLFLDTFTPEYAADHFRPDAYHTWTTDKVIDGGIVEKSVEDGGSWRITDPDTGAWSGVDYARTWGGRYRFHFFDLGAAPNSYEDATWANYGAAMSNEYPMGDPPVWQYDADPQWQQSGDTCQDPGEIGIHYTGDVPCRMMPRLARDVAYGLFFRSTAGYLYRPIPKGDVYWLATSNWTDFYSRPQWVNGGLVGAPYGTWWSDLDKLYQVDTDDGTTNHDDTLRWLSSATPYVRWVGRRNQVIPLYDPDTNQPTGKTLDTSPKYADLPAPEYHVQASATGTKLVKEPLYGGAHEFQTTADGTKIDLTEISNQFEKAKAEGIVGLGYDDSVNTDTIRDYIDANRQGIADRVPGIGTLPSVNIVFEKAYTWALPVIVGGIAIDDANGEAWGVLNNVNDRFKWCGANYPVYDPTSNAEGDKVSMAPCHPKQETGGGFSYTIEHEAAHSLGLSHPHDGSYGVDKCPEGDPAAGEWACYWAGTGWVMDISAAPTTYAMAYRPYEVEDQDNLQRGHVVEYLLAGQVSLQTLLKAESASGATEPSAEFDRRYAAYRTWKAQAAELLGAGDYLHAEYAARNAALAAKGVEQTAANTIEPRLLEAGQVFYFKVHPQSTAGLRRLADLEVGDLEAEQTDSRTMTLSAVVSNTGDTDATGVVVRFADGSTTIDETAAVDLAAGDSETVSVEWALDEVEGTRTVTATADPDDVVAEEDEGNNAASRTVEVIRNLVPNGSFEEGRTRPDGWTGSRGAAYLTQHSRAADGEDLVSLSAAPVRGRPVEVTWRSDAFAVTGGDPARLSAFVAGVRLDRRVKVTVEFLDRSGHVVRRKSVKSATGTFAGAYVDRSARVPDDARQARVVIRGFSAGQQRGTAYVDDVVLW